MSTAVSTPTIVLMGLRGSGKSTLGKLLAQQLGTTFVDLDDHTPAVLNASSVAEAWAAHGESGFRSAEAEALQGIFKESQLPGVLALGGGTPTGSASQSYLRELRAAGRIKLIYLRATPTVLRARLSTADNAHRPPLVAGSTSAVDEIEMIFAARDPLYRELAYVVMEIDGLDVAIAVAKLAKHSR